MYILLLYIWKAITDSEANVTLLQLVNALHGQAPKTKAPKKGRWKSHAVTAGLRDSVNGVDNTFVILFYYAIQGGLTDLKTSTPF